jgi:hypothetical protein
MVLRPSALERDHPVRTFCEDQQIRAGAGFTAAQEARPDTDDQSGRLHGFILSWLSGDGKDINRAALYY